MSEITSHTIVKHGMPFIGKVLEQVAPYMDRMIISLSQKCDDETRKAVMDFMEHHFHVVLLDENVTQVAELTGVRNEQVRITSTDWILFLDDDDYWPRDQLELCLKELDRDENILAYSVVPFQLVDFEHYDTAWEKSSFSKFLRRDGLHFIKPWPQDIPMSKDGRQLHWKKHPEIVKKLPYRFFHLSYLKNWSFRYQIGWEKYQQGKGNIADLIVPFRL